MSFGYPKRTDRKSEHTRTNMKIKKAEIRRNREISYLDQSCSHFLHKVVETSLRFLQPKNSAFLSNEIIFKGLIEFPIY